MTTQELDALQRLEYNLDRLAELVASQSLMLREQQAELTQLRQDKLQLTKQLQAAQERVRLAEVSRALTLGSEQERTIALDYLAEIIDDVKQSLRQLELE
ncbi:MAG: hypothetical protein SPK09_04675 [Porphyromonas sp.]|nr:hypothetical protein [Porphyromonas sp.]